MTIFRSKTLTRSQRRDKNKRIREKRKLLGFAQKVLVDGIEYKRGKLSDEMLEFCRTPEAKAQRRLEVWQQAKGDCQGCGHGLGDPEDSTWEWHHAKFRSQHGDDSLKNAQALCRDCHRLAHGVKVSRHTQVEI